MEFAVLLLTPLLGALLLAVGGARPRAAEINIAHSFGTFLAAVAVTVRVINEGNLTAANEQEHGAVATLAQGCGGRGGDEPAPPEGTLGAVVFGRHAR